MKRPSGYCMRQGAFLFEEAADRDEPKPVDEEESPKFSALQFMG